MSTAAELMVECLEAEGVTLVFGIPGEENIHFTRALAGSSQIRYVLTRHEQGAAFMAEMYGRVTGRPAVVSATLGPGAINMQLGVADATTNSTPLVAISAQVGQDREYKESHQYVDLVSMFAPITRWSDGVPTTAAIPEMFRKAFKLAETERPAAVYLAVPEHIDADEDDYDLKPLPRNVVQPEAPSPRQVVRAVDLLRSAKRPVILAGHGAARADATAALVRLSEELGVRVANTFHGKGVMPDDHPNSMGTIGFMRHDYVNFGFDDADLIIAVGYELQEFDPVRINPNSDKRIIHIHRFPAEVDVHYPVDVGIIGDISESLDAVRESMAGHRFDDRRRRSRRWPARRGIRSRTTGLELPAVAATHRRRHQRRAGPQRRGAGRHRCCEDVDGASLPHLRTQHLPDLQRPVHHGVRPARGVGREAGAARSQGARGDGRRRLPDEQPGDRDRGPRADSAGGADLGGRRVRPDRVEDGPRTRRSLLRRVHQPRRRASTQRASAPRATGSRPPTNCCRPCAPPSPTTACRSSRARSTTRRTCA